MFMRAVGRPRPAIPARTMNPIFLKLLDPTEFCAHSKKLLIKFKKNSACEKDIEVKLKNIDEKQVL